MDTRSHALPNQPLWNVFQRVQATAEPPGRRKSQLSGPARGYDYILPEGFRFPFGDYFSIAIDNLDTTHVVWGEGANYKSRARSGTLAAVSLLPMVIAKLVLKDTA